MNQLYGVSVTHHDAPEEGPKFSKDALAMVLDAVAEARLQSLFAHIREEVLSRKGRAFQLLLDAKFNEDARLVGDACVDLKHRFDTQSR